MRVYPIDLLPFQKQDLFNVEIPPQAISRRIVPKKLRCALDSGQAEYLGWIVPGDELVLDMSTQTENFIGEFMSENPDITRWVVVGFDSPSLMTLRPRILAIQNLSNTASVAAKTMKTKGWRPAVDAVFGECKAVVVRRDILGRPRYESRSRMPVSWTTDSKETE
jgi:CRISPR-associated endonuclease Csn1